MESNDTDISTLSAALSGLRIGGKLLPLQSVSITAKVTDINAEIFVVQVYDNPDAVPLSCNYLFPLPSSASVCDFFAEIDGVVIQVVSMRNRLRKRFFKQRKQKGMLLP